MTQRACECHGHGEPTKKHSPSCDRIASHMRAGATTKCLQNTSLMKVISITAKNMKKKFINMRVGNYHLTWKPAFLNMAREKKHTNSSPARPFRVSEAATSRYSDSVV